ncbi:MAG: site-specific integrase [Planctomycetaceae bacterium]|nr:site-specific integrase [Planctomycetaceae bacterium]
MANLFKKKVMIKDKATGQKVASESKKWWGQYRDALGILRHKPLAADKKVAQLMLNDIMAKVEKEKSGTLDPFDAEMNKPIQVHIDDFEKHLKSKNSDPRHVGEVIAKIKRCKTFCHWERTKQIRASDVENFLLDLRENQHLSIQTSNHYLKALKAFTRWLVRNLRMKLNPLDVIEPLNVRIDHRHDRRALEMEEFILLVQAAETGPPAVGLTGQDRAMLYILAAWTGFRRGELGSLTLRSFNLKRNNPTVSVEAAYSKHRRDDIQVLHSDIVERFLKWLEIRKPENESEILFPISNKTSDVDRRTSEMMMFDLSFARNLWLTEAKGDAERQTRAASDFLRYQDSQGKFADFHALRHTFITNLSRANVSPKVAQTLARHSDIRLTMQIYTHIDSDEQAAAINSLPGLSPKN